MWTGAWSLAEFKGYMSLLTEHRLPNIVIVMVAKQLRKENRIMSKTAIVPDAPRAVHNGIRISTTAEGGRSLEELRAAYQMLGREERQQIKSLTVTLSISSGDLLSRKGSTNRRDN
jgi:hypothetical protein